MSYNCYKILSYNSRYKVGALKAVSQNSQNYLPVWIISLLFGLRGHLFTPCLVLCIPLILPDTYPIPNSH